MAKVDQVVGGPLSVVKFCTSMLCVQLGYRQVDGPLSLRRFSHTFEHPKSAPYYFNLPHIVGYS